MQSIESGEFPFVEEDSSATTHNEESGYRSLEGKKSRGTESYIPEASDLKLQTFQKRMTFVAKSLPRCDKIGNIECSITNEGMQKIINTTKVFSNKVQEGTDFTPVLEELMKTIGFSAARQLWKDIIKDDEMALSSMTLTIDDNHVRPGLEEYILEQVKRMQDYEKILHNEPPFECIVCFEEETAFHICNICKKIVCLGCVQNIRQTDSRCPHCRQKCSTTPVDDFAGLVALLDPQPH